jgi:hypothetical protein
MRRFLTAFTFEIDEPKIASAEILEQLKIEYSLLKNSAGFLFCSWDFVASGVVEEVSRALPFEVIGCTTHGIAVPGAMGEVMLAVAVLTSDESSFRVGLSDPLDADPESRIGELYARLTGGGALPSLMFVCHPRSVDFTGDQTVEALNRVSGGSFLFGTNALDETMQRRSPLVFHNGAAYPDRIALLLLHGPVESRFFIESLPVMTIYSRPVLVTQAQGSRIISINNRPAVEFLESHSGISRDNINSVYSFPLLVDNHDGAGPKPCGIHSVEEDGSLCCGSAVNAGATLKLVNQVQEQVLRSSTRFAESIKKENAGKNHLIFSCFGRSTPLVDLKDEMELVQKYMRGTSYMFVYSGGEFCPIYKENGGFRNRFHQFSIVSASF